MGDDRSWPSPSPALWARLEKECDDLLASMRETPPAVGESKCVPLDLQFAKEEKISSWARMDRKEGKVTYFAGTLELDRTPLFSYDTRNFFDFADAFASKEREPVLDMKRIQASVETPVPIAAPATTSDFRTVEAELLKQLGALGEVTIVNPSFGAMSRLKRSGGGKVMLDPHVKPFSSDFTDLHDFVKNSKGTLKVVAEPTEISYLGFGDPKWRPDSRWVSLVQDPYSAEEHGDLSSVSEHDWGVELRLSFDGRQKVHSILDEERVFLYNPWTLGKFLDVWDCSFWLKASFPLIPIASHVEMSTIPHTPQYLSSFPDISVVTYTEKTFGETGEYYKSVSVKMREKDKVVYDVQGGGTYLSRRARAKLPEGYVWAPFVKSGKVIVSRYSNHPTLSNGFQEIVVRGVSHTFFGVPKVRVEAELLPGPSFTEIPISGVQPRETKTTQGKKILFFRQDDLGSYDPQTGVPILPDAMYMGTWCAFDRGKWESVPVPYYRYGPEVVFHNFPRRSNSGFLLMFKHDFYHIHPRVYMRLFFKSAYGLVTSPLDGTVHEGDRKVEDVLSGYLYGGTRQTSWEVSGIKIREMMERATDRLSGAQVLYYLRRNLRAYCVRPSMEIMNMEWSDKDNLQMPVSYRGQDGQQLQMSLSTLLTKIKSSSTFSFSVYQDDSNVVNVIDFFNNNGFRISVKKKNLDTFAIVIRDKDM